MDAIPLKQNNFICYRDLCNDGRPFNLPMINQDDHRQLLKLGL